MQFRLIAASLLLATTGLGVSTMAHAESDCRYTQGYWQNRAQNTGDITGEIWLALRNVAFYRSGVTYGQVLTFAPRGNAYWILAQQMVAAQANRLNRADTSGAPAQALARSEAIMNAVTPAQIAAEPRNSALRQEMIQLASVLDAWNNGVIGTGRCNVGGSDNHVDD